MAMENYLDISRFWRLCCILCIFSVSGCATPTPVERIESADTQSRSAGFTRLPPEGRLPTVAFVKSGAGAELAVYFEGDGYAFATPYLASDDPTPLNPLGLKLALADRRTRVLYIGRPCQFSPNIARTPCATRYWTTARYADEIIQSVESVLDAELRRRPARTIHLVGYSGGGAVAILLAARRRDITTIVTVAGNLDHRLHTSTFNLQPLTGSLNPRDVAREIAAIPQIHYAGARDPIVPPTIARSFMSALPNQACATMQIVDGATHVEPWVDIWPSLTARRPQCRN